MNFKWCTYQGRCWDKPAHVHTEEEWEIINGGSKEEDEEVDQGE